MKIRGIATSGQAMELEGKGTATRSGQRGSAVIVVMALLSIILVYLAFNTRTLHLLHRHVQLVEKQQLHRLAALNSVTNPVSQMAPPVAASPSNSAALRPPTSEHRKSSLAAKGGNLPPRPNPSSSE